MFGTKVERLRDEAMAEAKAARVIAEKADGEGRNLTAEEKGQYDGHMKAARAAVESDRTGARPTLTFWARRAGCTRS